MRKITDLYSEWLLLEGPYHRLYLHAPVTGDDGKLAIFYSYLDLDENLSEEAKERCLRVGVEKVESALLAAGWEIVSEVVHKALATRPWRLP